MARLFKKYGYLLFVIFFVLFLTGGYMLHQGVDSNQEIFQVTSQTRKYVRHEKNENKLNPFEKYLESKLAVNFDAEQLRTISLVVIVASFVLLVMQPLILWLILRSKPKKSKRKLNYRHPYQIDQDDNPKFQVW